MAVGPLKAAPRWSVVVPYYNERQHIAVCLQSLARQSVPFRLILVDNGSNDGSSELAALICHDAGLDAVIVHEGRPGKVAALQCGLQAVTTELVATCDADTIYPPDYLARATALLEHPGVVAAIAATAAPRAPRWRRRLAGMRLELTARALPQQCLNGGAGQVFRTAGLRAAGGFDPQIWNWVLEDHEIIARLERHGSIAYHRHFLCHPAARPRRCGSVGWRLAERLRYHATDPGERVAFFHAWLGPRMRRRALTSDRLRREAPHFGPIGDIAALYPLR
ncbi:MAG: glycosyltransferase family 2 protein [Novosphingobium sp.]|nr:glycosyltransferase family 2 protein [Novosphingobium sp.]